ncbi:hypothetical protein KC850_00080 [Candidatus Kaiserbacteria bacterium]|nr:hypothetical protein [Candidatus Kaiserbacteria bacterium]
MYGRLSFDEATQWHEKIADILFDIEQLNLDCRDFETSIQSADISKVPELEEGLRIRRKVLAQSLISLRRLGLRVRL